MRPARASRSVRPRASLQRNPAPDPARYSWRMAECQYVRVQRVGPVALAEVLREKITEHENTPVFDELGRAAASSGHRLAVDLGGVGLLSSAGLGGLISLHKACVAGGGRL